MTEDDWSGKPEDVTADLTPFLSSSDFDWLSVLPAVRELFATSGGSVVTLPFDIDTFALQHQDRHVICLPSLPGRSMSRNFDVWPCKTEMGFLLFIGDSVPDKPFCIRGGAGGPNFPAFLFYIATSFFQIRGQQVDFGGRRRPPQISPALFQCLSICP